MVERARRAAAAEPVLPGQQPQADPGLLPRPRHPRRHRGDPADRQARQAARPRRSPHCWSPRPGATEEQAATLPRARPRSGSPTRRFVERVRALGVEDELLETGLTELAAVVEGCAARRQRPRDASRPTCASPAGSTTTPAPSSRSSWSGYERLKSVAGGGRYDALASDGRTTYPGVGISFGVSRTLVPLFADGVLAGAGGAEHGAGRPDRRGVSRPASDAVATALRAPRHHHRGRRDRAEVRQADPVRRAPRHPLRLVPATSNEVKDIRSGEQQPPTPTPGHHRSGEETEAQ